MTNVAHDNQHDPASFRDPAGYIFSVNGKYYRQINPCYSQDYEKLMSAGLYQKLTEKKLLISHTEIKEVINPLVNGYKTILPEQLPFISYPYEWSFDELKDAAITTLRVLKISVKQGMILKDATPFNIQFYKGQPIFIDTLSFETYDETKPWIAYRQFCECFLFPLLLAHYHKMDAQKLLAVYLDGIPATTTAKLLPLKSRFKLNIWLHVFLQASVSKQNNNQTDQKPIAFSKEKLLRLIESLQSTIKSLQVETSIQSTWNNYYDETILSQSYLSEKEKIFRNFMSDASEGRTMDIGCNDGYFSKILAEKNSNVVAVDFDSQCVNKLYLELKEKNIGSILPLCIDLTNPSPALGFNHTERKSFAERATADTVTALALVHHLVLSKNIPLQDVAKMLADLVRKQLIIEFVPINDIKSQQLIANKPIYHKPYDPEAFETHFSNYFEIEKKQTIPGTERILYSMKRK